MSDELVTLVSGPLIPPGCGRQTFNVMTPMCNREDVAGKFQRCFCGSWINSDGSIDQHPWRSA